MSSKKGGVQVCRCSLLIVLRPLCNSCTIFLSWAKFLDSFLATGGLSAFVLVCFGHRLLGMWMGYYVGGSRVASCSVQEKHCSRATLSWFVLEGAVTDLGWRRSCQGEGHDELYDSGEAAGKPVPRARKSAGLKPSRFTLSPPQLKSDCRLYCSDGNLPALLRCHPRHLRKMHLTTCPVPAGMSGDILSFPEIHCKLLGQNRMCK